MMGLEKIPQVERQYHESRGLWVFCCGFVWGFFLPFYPPCPSISKSYELFSRILDKELHFPSVVLAHGSEITEV